MTSAEHTQSRMAIDKFRQSLREMEVPRIDISATSNQSLLALYEHIKFTYSNQCTGILVVDKKGVYTPIEQFSDNVVHLVRLPKSNYPVYAISDMRAIVYTEVAKLTIIFQGVYLSVTGSYVFISREYYIRPVPGISFEKMLIVQLLIIDARFKTVTYEESDDTDYSDDGLD